jgi:hypothetical protein
MPEVRVQNGVSPIAKGEMKVRSVAAKQKDEGFIPVTTQSGEVMWVHPDIVHDEQWTKVSRKGKNKSSNVISVSKEDDVALPETLYSDEERPRVLTAQPATAQQQGTRSGQAYLKQYDQVVGPAPQPSTSGGTLPGQPSKPVAAPLDKAKAKEVRFDKSLKKDSAQGLDAPYQFDILAQLANIPARITLHELLRLSKETREALREALMNSESFLAQLPSTSEPGETLCSHCHTVMAQQMPCITFSPQDMLLKGKPHVRPLYLNGYIGSTLVERIQIDPGSALSIIPRRLLNFLNIPLHKLSSTNTTIVGFNTGSSSPWERFAFGVKQEI